MKTYYNPISGRRVIIGLRRTEAGQWLAYYTIPYLDQYEEFAALSRSHARYLVRQAARIAWAQGYVSLPVLIFAVVAVAALAARLALILTH